VRFTYTYRSSDGQRHSAEIEADSRDDAFARVRRDLGVKPIKVVAAVEDSASRRGAGAESPSAARRAILLLAAGLALCAIGGGLLWWRTARRGGGAPYQIMTPHGPVTYTVATPLPRQAIPGDRQRIDAARATAFRSSAEAWLARFAEPGRHVGETSGRAEHAKGGTEGRDSTRPSPARGDFEACLKEPIRIASTDFTEVVDLKRIVTGMKREMRAYLAGGGSVEGYLGELERRQRLEISYRERAEQKLNEMFGGADTASRTPQSSARGPKPETLKAAYAYWLKANAQLQAMGIYPLAIPDALRAYQMGMDIDE